MPANQPVPPKLKARWFYPIPGLLPIVLLVMEGILLLSERFQWFAFNERKGWTVLITVGVIGVFLLLMLFWFILSLFFRWCFQFSIRSLLVLTVAVAILFSWLAVEMKWAKEQKEAREALIQLGGNVSYEDMFYVSPYPEALQWMRNRMGDDFFRNVAFVDIVNITDVELEHLKAFRELHWLTIKGNKFTDAGLEHLRGLTQLRKLEIKGIVTDVGLEHIKGLTQLQSLHLDSSTVTDVGLEHFKGLTQLQSLALFDTEVTDVGLEHLKGLTQLQDLFLFNAKVTGVGLEHLNGLTQLQYLDLSNTEVTDAGLEHLKGLTQLKELNLSGTEVTNFALEHLKGLTQLKVLHLRNTKVTDAGLAKLHKALPNLIIERKEFPLFLPPL